MHTIPEDKLIIAQVLEGRKPAFGILVSRYQHYVFSLTLRYIPTREEAEEAAQDVFVKAYRNLASFRGDSKFSTWLFSIVHTTCISRLRLKQHNLVATDEEILIHIADTTTADTIKLLEGKSRAKVLEQAISRLKTEDAAIITLFYQAEQSLEEISRILTLPAPTVKVRLYRARQKLREILLNYFPEEVADFNAQKMNVKQQ